MKKVSIGLVMVLALVLIFTACAPAPATISSPVQTTAATTQSTQPTITTTTSVQPTASASPTSTAAATPAPVSGGVLKIVPRLIATTFGYPSDFNTSASADNCVPCIESICGVGKDGYFLPQLATACEISQDGKSITFALRKGVKFHDGSDFNAQTAKWNMEISMEAKLQGTTSWTSIEALDDYTLRLNIKAYENTIFAQLNTTAGKIVSRTAVEKNGVEWAHTNPVGTGPFKFASYTPDVGIKWVRNDNYWGGKPYLDELDFVFISDDMARSAALQSGGVDAVIGVTPETAIALKAKGFVVDQSPEDNLLCLVPDSANADSPLSNLKVRQAIEYAIDRNSLSQLGNGYWLPLNQPCTPVTPGYIANFAGREYNPEKAKQLLTEAGYPNGFKIGCIYAVSTTTPDSMTAIQQYLSKVGITFEPEKASSTQRNDYTLKGWNNSFIATGQKAGINYLKSFQRFGPNQYVSLALTPAYKDSLNKGLQARDSASIVAASKEFNTAMYDEAIVIPLYSIPLSIYAMTNKVHDIGAFYSGSDKDMTLGKTWLSK